jgi:hypothetical protein
MTSHESSLSIPDQDSSRWKLDYESALQETDHQALFKRIEVAEAAILTRREALESGLDGLPERREIKAALATIWNLKKDVLKFM